MVEYDHPKLISFIIFKFFWFRILIRGIFKYSNFEFGKKQSIKN